MDGDIPGAPATVQAALDGGLGAETILRDGMIAAMTRVGELYECGDYYVAEMFTSAKALQAALVVLRPMLQQSQVQATGTVVIGTVKGDMHDIGKNLVTMMLGAPAMPCMIWAPMFTRRVSWLPSRRSTGSRCPVGAVDDDDAQHTGNGRCPDDGRIANGSKS